MIISRSLQLGRFTLRELMLCFLRFNVRAFSFRPFNMRKLTLLVKANTFCYRCMTHFGVKVEAVFPKIAPTRLLCTMGKEYLTLHRVTERTSFSF